MIKRIVNAAKNAIVASKLMKLTISARIRRTIAVNSTADLPDNDSI